MADEVKRVLAIVDKDQKLAASVALLPKLLDSKDLNNILNLLKAMVDEKQTSTIVSRPVVTEFASLLKKDEKLDPSFKTDLIEKSVEALSVQATVFEEQIANLRYNLAKLYIAQEAYETAAKILQLIPLESGRVYPITFKFKVYVKIAQLYLEEEKSLEAERFLNKASAFTNKKGVKPKDKSRYQSSYVQIRDYNRKFAEAAAGYFRLAELVPEHEREAVLERGVRAAVLAPAGPQRSRLLALYYKDERTRGLPNFAILEKMFLGRILKPDEVKAFEASLEEHQRATSGKGVSILDQAMREHNLSAAARVYNSIAFDQLGTLLGMTAADAEALASKMIAENRLHGTIDQMKQLLYFKSDSSSTIEDWDARIEATCNAVNEIVDMVTRRHPEWAAKISK